MRDDKVLLIFDPQFGEKLRPLASASPIWIINSSENDAVAHDLWSSKIGNITTFKPADFGELLDTIDEHHSGWKELEVIGETLTDNASEALLAHKPSTVVSTNAGFLVKR
jgi:hypothetical protein